jgi:hypothetical protein
MDYEEERELKAFKRKLWWFAAFVLFMILGS